MAEEKEEKKVEAKAPKRPRQKKNLRAKNNATQTQKS
jgi:hypothetical protein